MPCCSTVPLIHACILLRNSCAAHNYSHDVSVPAEQCGNAAYGVCQAKAMDPKQSPCGSAFKGMANCNEAEFQKFYTGGCFEQHAANEAVYLFLGQR